MKKRIVLALAIVLWGVLVNAQNTIQANEVKAIDSIKIKDKWVKSVITDSSLSGSTHRDLVSAESVRLYVLNHILNAVKTGDTANMMSGYVRVVRFLDSLVAVQGRIQTKLTKSDADGYYPAIQRMVDSLTAVQARIQGKEPLIGYTPENAANKAANNGYASLDAGGKVPVSQLPSSVVGSLNYQGSWNASTNSPTLTSGTGTKGFYYVVSTAGSTNIDGEAVWKQKDWIVFNGTAWERISNTQYITSVNGFTGDVTLNTDNISEGSTNKYYTDTRARAAISETVVGIEYSGGVISITSGYAIPTTTDISNGNAGYNDKINSITFSASTLTLTQQDGGTVTQSVPTFNQSTTGNAATVTNGVYTTGSYSDPSWITAVNYSKLTGTIPTWNQNTTGNAATATTASTWAGNSYGSGDGAVSTYVLGYKGSNTWGPVSVSYLQSFLTLGSNAYTSTAYLPLTGGTLSGNVVLSNSDARFNGGDASGRLIVSNNNTTTYMAFTGASNALPSTAYVVTNGTTAAIFDASQNLLVTKGINSKSSLSVNKDGSNTAAVGAFVELGNTADSRYWLMQLGATNDYDWWYYNGSTNTNLAKLSTGGNFTASGAITSNSGGIISKGGFVQVFANGSGLIGVGSHWLLGDASQTGLVVGQLNASNDMDMWFNNSGWVKRHTFGKNGDFTAANYISGYGLVAGAGAITTTGTVTGSAFIGSVANLMPPGIPTGTQRTIRINVEGTWYYVTGCYPTYSPD